MREDRGLDEMNHRETVTQETRTPKQQPASNSVIILKLDPTHLVDTKRAGMCTLSLPEPAGCKLSLAVLTIMWLMVVHEIFWLHVFKGRFQGSTDLPGK